MTDLADLTTAVGREITAGLTDVDEAAAIGTYSVLWDALQAKRRGDELVAMCDATLTRTAPDTWRTP